MAFLEKGHFVRIFELSSKIRQLKKCTDGLFQQPVRGYRQNLDVSKILYSDNSIGR